MEVPQFDFVPRTEIKKMVIIWKGFIFNFFFFFFECTAIKQHMQQLNVLSEIKLKSCFCDAKWPQIIRVVNSATMFWISVKKTRKQSSHWTNF